MDHGGFGFVGVCSLVGTAQGQGDIKLNDPWKGEITSCWNLRSAGCFCDVWILERVRFAVCCIIKHMSST